MNNDQAVNDRMRSDWNERAREDPHYYVAFGGRDQDEEGFLATAADVLRLLEGELPRLAILGRDREGAVLKYGRALEIGCGPGRLMKPLSRHFGEIHGVDVSDEMIRLARRALARHPQRLSRTPPTARAWRSSPTSRSISFIPTPCSSTSPAATSCSNTCARFAAC